MVKKTECLSKTVERFWSLENYGTCQNDDIFLILPLKEQKALEKLENTVQFVDNHYSVGLLWKENEPTLPYKKSLALSRFHSLEKKFKKHPQFAEKDKNIANDNIKKGLITKKRIITRRSKVSFACDKLCGTSWCYQCQQTC